MQQLSFVDLLRRSLYSRMAGYEEDVNDAGRLSHDPTFPADRFGLVSPRPLIPLWTLAF